MVNVTGGGPTTPAKSFRRRLDSAFLHRGLDLGDICLDVIVAGTGTGCVLANERMLGRSSRLVRRWPYDPSRARSRPLCQSRRHRSIRGVQSLQNQHQLGRTPGELHSGR